LWNGRASQLRGRFTGERNAFSYYLKVHIPDEAIEKGARPPGNTFAEPQRRLIRVAKGHAAYWMGWHRTKMGDMRAAQNHLQKRTLEQQPGGPFTSGARYNLARVYEAQGEQDLERGEAESASGHSPARRRRWPTRRIVRARAGRGTCCGQVAARAGEWEEFGAAGEEIVMGGDR